MTTLSHMQINGIFCSSIVMAFLFPPASPNHRCTSHSTGDPSVSSKTLNRNPGPESLLIFSPSSPFGSPSLFFHAPLPVSWRFQSRFLCWSQGFIYVKCSLSVCCTKGWKGPARNLLSKAVLSEVFHVYLYNHHIFSIWNIEKISKLTELVSYWQDFSFDASSKVLESYVGELHLLDLFSIKAS